MFLVNVVMVVMHYNWSLMQREWTSPAFFLYCFVMLLFYIVFLLRYAYENQISR